MDRAAVDTEPLDPPRQNGRRRLQVDAFGFGGSNYVMHVEEARDGVDTMPVSRAERSVRRRDGRRSRGVPGVSCGRTEMVGRTYRVAVVAALRRGPGGHRGLRPLAQGRPAPKTLRVLRTGHLHQEPQGTPCRPSPWSFPAGSEYAGTGEELDETFPVMDWMDRAAVAANFDLLHLLFDDREENLQDPLAAARHIRHGTRHELDTYHPWVDPQAMAGHSLGELTALARRESFPWRTGSDW